DLLAEIERAELAHQRVTERAIALKLDGQSAGFFAQSVEPAREVLERRLASYIYHERQLLEQTDSAASQKTALTSVLVLMSGLLSVGFTIILAILMTRRLSRLYETEQDQRRAAEAARQRYHDLVEGIPGGFVWEADASTLRMTFVSSRAETMLGYRREESLAYPDFWM